ncbi:MarR family transcriptional regulator [Ligilactobacillus pobuzihii]|uniref:MarR family winged helix-turn-helix transcriptional regulator n=1 Tax=Ligilactobacillus pobuzihii TaxID=449659 RepID=UPI0019D2B141|nr:MarR family transcriptional regulator [Ligilactobacillus pobuzihii]MBN7274829.1 MarR family transcriptional regulator [Ligilactobacillus pobuzihii]HIZ95776.1 MarR family transcriptional regulator [Candidatus Ligilactobacillus excrementavium]
MKEYEPGHIENELCFAIYSAQKFYTKFYSESLKEFNLTYPQYLTLLVLWEERRPMMIKEIGARLKLDTGTLTPLLKRMEKDEWVTRTHVPEDGRKVYIELTKKGIDSEDDVKNQVKTCLDSIDMTYPEYEDSVQTVKSIGKKIKKVDETLEGR